MYAGMCMELWEYVIIWPCAHVPIWLCVHVIIWPCVYVIIWPCAHVIIWPCAHVIIWPCVHMIIWPCAHVIIWLLLVTAKKHAIQGANPSLLITHLAWHTGTGAQKKQPPRPRKMFKVIEKHFWCVVSTLATCWFRHK